MLRTVAARVLFGLIALLFVFRAENSSAQATDPNIKKKCVPGVPSAGDVLVTGGEDINEIQSGNTEFFHPATGAWVSTCPTKVAHDEAQMLPYGTGLIEIGGEQSKVDLKTFHIMNRSTEVHVPATGKFTAGPALKSPLEDFAAVKLANGSIMVAGGVAGTDAELAVQNAEILSGKIWKKLKAKMTTQRAAPCAAVMTGGSKSGQVLIAAEYGGAL